VVRKNLLLGAAVVGVLVTGAIAQTSSNIERIKDPAGHQNAAHPAEPKKNVRTVYPNTQNAEQAIEQSKTARGGADASKRQPGEVTPLSSAQQSSAPVGGKATPQPVQSAQQNQQSVPAPSPQQNAPAASAQQATSSAQQPPAASAPAASQPAPVQTAQPSTQPPQPSSAPPPAQQSVPTATAQQSPPSGPPASQPSKHGSTGVIALNTEQQMSIGQTIARHNVKAITDVNFSIAIGTKVPTSVQLRALPSDLVTFVPQYRGYSYVVVEEQIMIVDPGSHEIVAIVPYTAAAPELTTRTVETVKPRASAAEKPIAQKPAAQKPVAQKPMVTRSVNLNTEHKSEARRPATEQRKTMRSAVRREYREERAPRAVTIEEEAEARPVPVQRGPRFFDDDDEGPRPGGFFGFFR